MYENILIVIGVLSGSIGLIMSYVTIKKATSHENLMDFIDYALTEISQDEDMQKKLYVVGALLGNGVKSGVGLDGKGGKLKFTDLIMQAGLSFIQSGKLDKVLGGNKSQNQQQPQQTSEQGSMFSLPG